MGGVNGMKKGKKNKIIVLTVLAVLLMATIIVGIVIYKNQQAKKLSAANQLQSNQEEGSNTEDQNNQTESQSTPTNTSTPQNNQTNSPSVPEKPTFTKSSGNNGPIPQNVLVEFVCTTLPGLECQIILVNSNGQKITLPFKPVADNGRGQYFTSWQWKGQQGNWSITAQSKNSEGGTNTSEKQTLVVK